MRIPLCGACPTRSRGYFNEARAGGTRPVRVTGETVITVLQRGPLARDETLEPIDLVGFVHCFNEAGSHAPQALTPS